MKTQLLSDGETDAIIAAIAVGHGKEGFTRAQLDCACAFFRDAKINHALLELVTSGRMLIYMGEAGEDGKAEVRCRLASDEDSRLLVKFRQGIKDDR